MKMSNNLSFPAPLLMSNDMDSEKIVSISKNVECDGLDCESDKDEIK